MTMNGGGALRHTACKSCRERKVRCGGEQPACAKCRRAGEECVYLPTQRPTRADLTQTVEALQKRLYETEARIQRMISREQQQQQHQQQQQGGSVMAPRSPPIHAAAAWSTSAEFSGPAALFHCPLPSFASPAADAEAPAGRAAYPSLGPSFPPHNPSSPGSLNNDFLDSLQPSASPQTTLKPNGAMHLGRGDDGRNRRTGSDDVDISATLVFSAFGADSDHHHHHQHQHPHPDPHHHHHHHQHHHHQPHSSQGYVDVTAPSTSSGSVIGSSSSATLHDAAVAAAAAAAAAAGAGPTAAAAAATTTTMATATVPQGGTQTGSGAAGGEGISAPMAGLLAEFSSSVFQSQAEIAGMSSAVADYIAWMRKVPTGIAPPNTSLVYVNVLEAVESRLREMREIAQTRPRAAFRDMVAALQALGPAGASVCDSLADLEKEFDRQAADVANFFQTRYNACAALSEQAQSIPRSPASARRGSDGSGNSSHRAPIGNGRA